MIMIAGEAEVREVVRRLAEGPALRASRERLAAAGLAPRPEPMRALRALGRALLVLLVTATLLGQMTGGPGGLPVMFLSIAAVLPLTRLTAPAHATRDGQVLVDAARTRAAGFAQGGLPGQRDVAVALFGIPALWQADARLAWGLGFRYAPSARRGTGRNGTGGCGTGGDSGGCGGGGGGG